MWVPPEEPTGEINLTDPDSRNMLAARGFVQGYNAQAAVNEQHVVIAAEICVVNPDFGNLEPVLLAAEAELASAGVTDTPEVVLADAGYWHTVAVAPASQLAACAPLRLRRGTPAFVGERADVVSIKAAPVYCDPRQIRRATGATSRSSRVSGERRR